MTVDARIGGREAAHRLRLIRRIYRQRGNRSRGVDLAYLVYLLVFASITAAFPVARALVLEAMSPGVQQAFEGVVDSGDFARIAALLGCALSVLFVALGTVRGPVAGTPFMISLLASGPVNRSRSLLPPFALVLGWMVVLFAALGALLGVALGAGSHVLLGAVAGALWAVLLGWCWLAGLLLGGGAWKLGLVLVAWGALGVWLPAVSPWGMGALIVQGEWALPGIGIGALCLLALLSIGPLLARLDVEELLAQARSWETAGDSAGLGDFSTAVGSLQPQVTHLRKADAVRELPLPLMFLVRDLVAALRTPTRFATSGAVLVASSFCAIWVSGAAGGSSGAAPAAIGAGFAVLVYLAVGGATDGYRHAAGTVGIPPVYGWSSRKLYLLHSLLPLVIGVLAVLLGGGAGLLFGPLRGGSAPALLLCTALIACACVVAKAFDSVKGPIPVVLVTTPISSPAGDPGIIFQFIWRGDALIYAAIAGAVAIHLESRDAFSGSAAACAFGLLFALGALRRIRRMS